MDVDVPMSAYRSNGKTLVPLTALHRVTQPPLLMQPEKVECFADLMRNGCEFAPVLVREEEGGFYVVLDAITAQRQAVIARSPISQSSSKPSSGDDQLDGLFAERARRGRGM